MNIIDAIDELEAGKSLTHGRYAVCYGYTNRGMGRLYFLVWIKGRGLGGDLLDIFDINGLLDALDEWHLLEKDWGVDVPEDWD